MVSVLGRRQDKLGTLLVASPFTGENLKEYDDLWAQQRSVLGPADRAKVRTLACDGEVTYSRFSS